MNKKKIRNTILMLLLLFGTFLLCGSGFSKNLPRLNPSEQPIYERCVLSELVRAFALDAGEASRSYNGHDAVLSGTVREVYNDGSFLLSDGDAAVLIDTQKKLSQTPAAGDSVFVYGTLSVPADAQSKLFLTAEHMDAGSRSGLRKDYYFYGGNSYSDKDSVECSLADGKLRYRVPRAWRSVLLVGDEKDALINLDSSAAEGYVLNALRGQEEAECFFIFYFSSEKYLAYDSDRDETYGIERAIIENICPDENLSWSSVTHYTFPTQSVTASYGTTFDSYVALYKTHRAEFVFTPVKDGLCVMLYVYRENESAVQDILYVMRSLQVAA